MTKVAFRLGAVGDISFEGSESQNPSMACFKGILGDFRASDFMVGNLECVLADNGKAIPGKCTLRGNPGWADIMKNAGIDLVSLANNHIMDYGKEGLFSTIETLRRAGIEYVGAGRNRREACAPRVLNVAGRRVAFLGRSAVIVSAPTYAGEDVPGVAFLDVEETVATIRSCRSQADFVILLVHWGIEEYGYPSPAQRQLARQFVDAGIDVVLGHHPHVLQGFEYYRGALIAYSLGNFVFNEFEWTYQSPNGPVGKQLSKLGPENKKGIILTLEWTGADCPAVVATYTTIEPHGRVSLDTHPARGPEMNALSASLRRPWYRLWWRFYAMRREWRLRLGERMSFRKLLANLHRIRPRHLIEALTALRRSGRIVSESTTNPYE